MNARDWFRKSLKVRVQALLHQPTRHPRARAALRAVVDRLWPDMRAENRVQHNRKQRDQDDK